jgi:DNA-binding transcriptional ArsR family regulator
VSEPSRGVFEALGDRVRRRILEVLGDGERPAGELVGLIGDEFGISQPATSQHLKALRDAGLVNARAAGRQRIYAIEFAGLDEAKEWLARFEVQFAQPLDALETELVRGRRDRRRTQDRGDDSEVAEHSA